MKIVIGILLTDISLGVVCFFYFMDKETDVGGENFFQLFFLKREGKSSVMLREKLMKEYLLEVQTNERI